MLTRFFPYTQLRPGQHSALEALTDALRRSRFVLFEAGSGFGKTAVVLAAALSRVVNERGCLLYVARTHVQADRAIDELLLLAKRGELIPAVSLRSRWFLCPLMARIPMRASMHAFLCNLLRSRGVCRMNRALPEIEFRSPLYTMDVLSIAESSNVCPYFLLKHLASRATLVSCTLWSLINPFAASDLQPLLTPRSRPLTIVFDEAHNLPTALVSTPVAQLLTRDLQRSVQLLCTLRVREVAFDLLEFYRLIERIFQSEKMVSVQQLLDAFDTLGFRIETVLHRGIAALHRARVAISRIPALLSVLEFLQALLHADCHDLIVASQTMSSEQKRTSLLLYSTRTATTLRQFVHHAKRVILMSATLEPHQSLLEIFNVKNVKYIRIPKINYDTLQIFVVKSVTTAFPLRNEAMLRRISHILYWGLLAVPGSCLVFFTSYDLLDAITSYGIFRRLPNVLIEERDASPLQRMGILEEFRSSRKAILFSVLGGRLSEGADFGNRVKAVFVVGIPFPPPSTETSVAVQLMELQFPGRGQVYYAVLPAIRSVIQAIGRATRGYGERVAAVLLDRRVLYRKYWGFFPSWIRDRISVVCGYGESLYRELRTYFSESSAPSR
mgnify:CR=1 FL=1